MNNDPQLILPPGVSYVPEEQESQFAQFHNAFRAAFPDRPALNIRGTSLNNPLHRGPKLDAYDVRIFDRTPEELQWIDQNAPTYGLRVKTFTGKERGVTGPHKHIEPLRLSSEQTIKDSGQLPEAPLQLPPGVSFADQEPQSSPAVVSSAGQPPAQVQPISPPVVKPVKPPSPERSIRTMERYESSMIRKPVSSEEKSLQTKFQALKDAGDLKEAEKIKVQLHDQYGWQTGSQDGWPWVKSPEEVGGRWIDGRPSAKWKVLTKPTKAAPKQFTIPGWAGGVEFEYNLARQSGDKAEMERLAKRLRDEAGYEAAEGDGGWWYIKPPDPSIPREPSKGTEAYVAQTMAREANLTKLRHQAADRTPQQRQQLAEDIIRREQRPLDEEEMKALNLEPGIISGLWNRFASGVSGTIGPGLRYYGATAQNLPTQAKKITEAIAGATPLPQGLQKRLSDAASTLASALTTPYLQPAITTEDVGRRLSEEARIQGQVYGTPGVAGDVAGAAGSSVPFFLTGGLGTAGRVAVGLLGWATSAGQVYEEALAAGKSPNEALMIAHAGGPAGLTEMFGIGGTLNRASRQALIRNFIRTILHEAGEEATQEAVQTAMNDLIAKGFYDSDRDILKDVSYSTIIAAITGGLFGATGHIAQNLTKPTPPAPSQRLALPPAPPGAVTESGRGRGPGEEIGPFEAPAEGPAQAVPPLVSTTRIEPVGPTITEPTVIPRRVRERQLLKAAPTETPAPTEPEPSALPKAAYDKRYGNRLEIIGEQGAGYRVRNEKGREYLIHRNAVVTGDGRTVYDKRSGKPLGVIESVGQGLKVINESGRIYTIHQNAVTEQAPGVVSSEETTEEKPKYKFSSTQVDIPEQLTTDIKAASARIPDADLAADGRETTPHITVKYGLHTENAEEVRPLLADNGPITVTLGDTKVFEGVENGTADAVVVEIDSPDLHRLNKKIADALPHTDTYPDYKPHLTLAYVKPGLGKAYAGDTSLRGKVITLDSLTFSSKTGDSIEIPLTGKPAEGTIEVPERRKEENVAFRKRVAEMSPEERAAALLTDDLTQLPNARALREADIDRPGRIVGRSDLDDFKIVNDQYGHESGDLVLQAKADILRAEGIEAYRTHGDEYEYRFDGTLEEATEALRRASEKMAQTEIELEYPDGRKETFRLPGFSFGTGRTAAEAEAGLQRSKAERKASGQRIGVRAPAIPTSPSVSTERLGRFSTEAPARSESNIGQAPDSIENLASIHSITRETGTKEIGAGTFSVWRSGDPQAGPRGLFFSGDRKGAQDYALLHGDQEPRRYRVTAKNILLAYHQNSITQKFFKKSYGDMHYEIDQRLMKRIGGSGDSVLAGRKLDEQISKEARRRGYDAIIYTAPAPPAQSELVITNPASASYSVEFNEGKVSQTTEIESSADEFYANHPYQKVYPGRSIIDQGRELEAYPNTHELWVFHATDKATAERFVNEGIESSKKPSNLARQRYQSGEGYAEYAPGRGLAPGLTVSLTPSGASGYGRQLIAIKIQKGDLHVPPEQAALGVTSPSHALAAEDAYITRTIYPNEIRLVGTPGRYPKDAYTELASSIAEAALQRSKEERKTSGQRIGVRSPAAVEGLGRPSATDASRSESDIGKTAKIERRPRKDYLAEGVVYPFDQADRVTEILDDGAEPLFRQIAPKEEAWDAFEKALGRVSNRKAYEAARQSRILDALEANNQKYDNWTAVPEQIVLYRGSKNGTLAERFENLTFSPDTAKEFAGENGIVKKYLIHKDDIDWVNSGYVGISEDEAIVELPRQRLQEVPLTEIDTRTQERSIEISEPVKQAFQDDQGNLLLKANETPKEFGSRLTEKHGPEIKVEVLPKVHREMISAGLNADDQVEAFKGMGYDFRSPLQMTATMRGLSSGLGVQPEVDLKYRSKGQNLSYRVVGRFPGSEKLLVLSETAQGRIIQSPYGETGNTRIRGGVTREELLKVPEISWSEVGLLSDPHPTTVEIRRVNPNANSLSDLSDGELKKNFPQVWQNLHDAEEWIGEQAAKEAVEQARQPESYHSMAVDIANDPHARRQANSLPETITRNLTVYRGGPQRGLGDYIYITTNREIAASHGPVTEYKIKPKALLFPDPEIEGFAATDLTGSESLLGSPEKQLSADSAGSAVIRITDLIPVSSTEPEFVTRQREKLQDIASGKRLSVNPLDALYASAVTLGYDLYKTSKDFAEWGEAIVKQLGEEARQFLWEVWSKLEYNPELASLTTEATQKYPAKEGLAREVEQRGNELVYRRVRSPREATAILESLLGFEQGELFTERAKGFEAAKVIDGHALSTKAPKIATAAKKGAIPVFVSPYPTAASYYNEGAGLFLAIEHDPKGTIYVSSRAGSTQSTAYSAVFPDAEHVIDARSIKNVYVLTPSQQDLIAKHVANFEKGYSRGSYKNAFKDKDSALADANLDAARNLEPIKTTLDRPFLEAPIILSNGLRVKKGDKVRFNTGATAVLLNGNAKPMDQEMADRYHEGSRHSFQVSKVKGLLPVHGNQLYTDAEGFRLKPDDPKIQKGAKYNQRETDIVAVWDKTTHSWIASTQLLKEYQNETRQDVSEIRDITKTSEFQRWSRGAPVITDSQFTFKEGDPVVVKGYHGTASIDDFDTFRTDLPSGKKEIYVTSSTKDAPEFTLWDKTPGRMRATLTPPLEGARILPLFVRMENPHVVNMEGREFNAREMKSFIMEALRAGQDGVIVENIRNFPWSDPSTTYIAFKPDQINSAISPGNPTPEDPAFVQRSRDRLRDALSGKISNANPVHLLYDTALVTGWDIWKTTKDYTEWTAQMIKKLGEQVRPHLQDVWDRINGKAPQWYSPLEVRDAVIHQGQPLFGHSEGEPELVIDARMRLSESVSGKRLSANPISDFVDMAIVTGWDIWQATKTFAGWSNQMVKKLGEKIRPYLEKIWSDLQDEKGAWVFWPNKPPAAQGTPGQTTPKIPPGEYIHAYWYPNTLSAPSTHNRNTTSNAAWMTTIQIPERVFKGALSLSIARIKGTPQEYYIREVLPAARGLLVGLPEGARDAFSILRGLPPKSALAALSQVNAPITELPGGGYNPINWPTRFLSAADAVARTMNATAELHAMATREALKVGLRGAAVKAHAGQLLTSPTPEMLKAAQLAGERGTFTGPPDKTERALLRLRDVGKLPADIPLIGGLSVTRLFVPFVSVPYKILKMGMELTPFGAGRLLSPSFRSDPAQAQAAAARALMGTSITVALLPYAIAGGITGGAPPDDRERDKFYGKGLQPYSIKIGNRWVSYRYMGPLAFPIAFSAGIADAYRRYGTAPSKNLVFQGVVTVGKLATDASFLQGIGEMFDALENEKKFEKFTSRLVSGFIPLSGMLRNIAQATDKTPDSGWILGDQIVRDPKSVYEFVTENVPGLRQKLPQKTGERGVRKGAAGLIAFGPGSLPPTDGVSKISLEDGIIEAFKAGKINEAREKLEQGVQEGIFPPGDPEKENDARDKLVARLRDKALLTPMQYTVKYTMDLEEALETWLHAPLVDKKAIARFVTAKGKDWESKVDAGAVPRDKVDSIRKKIEEAKRAGIREMAAETK